MRSGSKGTGLAVRCVSSALIRARSPSAASAVRIVDGSTCGTAVHIPPPFQCSIRVREALRRIMAEANGPNVRRTITGYVEQHSIRMGSGRLDLVPG